MRKSRKVSMYVKDIILNVCIVVSIIACLVVYGYIGYQENLSDEAIKAKVLAMYNEILAQTGQGQDALPLFIVNEDIDNAYNDGTKVVIYRGLIDHTKSWDEVALVLGHEVAHGMLGHLHNFPDRDGNQTAVLEGNADKMGAVYIMKAGYDICSGREIFLRWKKQNGNALGQDHPDYSYRYDELNINCD